MRWILTLLLCGRAFGAPSIEGAVQSLEGAYPWRRVAEGVPSIAYGALTGLGGVWMLLDSAHHNTDERTVGTVAAVLGGVLFLDGLSEVFGQSSGERFLRQHRAMPESGNALFPSRKSYDELALGRFSQSAARTRRVRGTLALLNASAYFYYYFSNPTRYRGAAYLGGGLVLIGLYRFLIPSPEEGAFGALGLGAVSGQPTLTFAWRL